jgi:hypothetical protein
MLLKKIKRSWIVGDKKDILITEKIKIQLDDNEQVSFVEKKNMTSYEICKKNWGYYVSPSIDKRLKDYGHKMYITKNQYGQVYLMAVDLKKIKKFTLYCKKEKLKFKILKFI